MSLIAGTRLGPGERLYCNDAELEALSELEHERWNAHRRMDGWRFADFEVTSIWRIDFPDTPAAA